MGSLNITNHKSTRTPSALLSSVLSMKTLVFGLTHTNTTGIENCQTRQKCMGSHVLNLIQPSYHIRPELKVKQCIIDCPMRPCCPKACFLSVFSTGRIMVPFISLLFLGPLCAPLDQRSAKHKRNPSTEEEGINKKVGFLFTASYNRT